MRGIAVLMILLLIATPVSALYREAVDDQGTYEVIDKRQYPIVFIPGVAGSELWAGNQNIWPGWLGQRITGGNFDKIALDKNGQSKHSIVATQSIRTGLELDLGGYGRQQVLPSAIIGIYGPFFDYMEDELNYSTEANPENGLRLLDFAYDWRKDNELTVQYLDAAIDDLLEETHSDKVILYAHSMGGVVARLYLAKESRAKKVAAVIFMGSPHQGSPKPFYAFVHGYNFGNSKLSDTTMWEIMGNWEAGYQLLSHDHYIVDAQTGEEWTYDQIYGDDWIGQQEYDHFIADQENWDIRYGLPNRKYAKSVRPFQQKLGDTLPQYDWITYYMIEGTDQETTQFLMATLTDMPGVDKPVLSLEEVKSKDGDGTVPARGAQVKGLSRTPSKVFTDHGSIPGWPGSQILFTEWTATINDEERRFQYAADIADYAEEKLVKVRGWPSTGSVWKWVGSLIGSFFKPDEEKISVREELRGSIRAMVENARVNVIIGKGDKQDEYFVVINDLEVVDWEPGHVKQYTMRVYIDSWETADALLYGDLKIEDAYRDGRVKVKSKSMSTGFKLLVGKWFAIYANRGSAPEPLNFEETLRLESEIARAEAE